MNELALRAKKGDREAIEVLCGKYSGAVKAIASNYFLPGAEQEDVIQYGWIGFLKGIETYNSEKQVNFDWFIRLSIKRYIFGIISSYNGITKSPLKNYLSLSYNIIEDNIPVARSPSPEKVGQKVLFLKDFKKYILKRFSELEIKVYNLLVKDYTYQEIQEALGVHYKSVDNTLQRIKKKARKFKEKWDNDY